MNRGSGKPKGPTGLRRQAAKALGPEAANFEPLPPEVARRAVHELRVHQIELETQNVELRRTQQELEASRTRYFQLYNLAPVSYFTLSGEGVILEANLAAATLLGVTRGALTKRLLARFVARADQDAYYLMRKQLVKTCAPQSVEVRLARKGETELWVSLEASLAPDLEGASLCRVVMFDVTANKEADERIKGYLEQMERTRATLEANSFELTRNLAELEVEKRRAEMATHAKSEFLSAMSHEIRTPMNGVLGMTELLLGTSLTQEQRGYAHTAWSSAHALLTIIDDILDLAKIEAGKIEFETMAFNLHDALEDIVDLLWVQAREKKLQLLLRYGADTPRVFLGDPGRIRQIVLNLCSNAVKFTHNGHVMIEASGKPGADGRVRIRIAVIDTGIGIPASRQALLFHKFQQVDSSTTRSYGGTGLGLAIARQLAELMGGSIQVESAVDVGSAFSFEIPLARDPAEEKRAAPPAAFAGKRILVLGESPVARLAIAEMLSRWGMLTEESALDEWGLRLATCGAYQLICLDGLPEVIAETAAALRVHAAGGSPGAAILVLASEEQKKAIDCDAYLIKPFREAKLLDAISRAMEVASGDGAQVKSSAKNLASVGQPGKVEPRRKRGRILVVEDNAINQKVSAALLAKLGYRVDVAGDGRHACEMAARVSYDVILMDCMMPVMDGYEATKIIRQNANGGHRTLVIALTAAAMAGDRARCLEAGMDDHLTKPTSLVDLQKMLDKWRRAGLRAKRTSSGR